MEKSQNVTSEPCGRSYLAPLCVHQGLGRLDHLVRVNTVTRGDPVSGIAFERLCNHNFIKDFILVLEDVADVFVRSASDICGHVEFSHTSNCLSIIDYGYFPVAFAKVVTFHGVGCWFEDPTDQFVSDQFLFDEIEICQITGAI